MTNKLIIITQLQFAIFDTFLLARVFVQFVYSHLSPDYEGSDNERERCLENFFNIELKKWQSSCRRHYIFHSYLTEDCFQERSWQYVIVGSGTTQPPSHYLNNRGASLQIHSCVSGHKGVNENMDCKRIANEFASMECHHSLIKVQYIPRNMHTVFALLCFVVVIHWLIFPYPSGLLHWHCGNLTIAPVPAKQPWWIWINTSCEFIMNDCITTTKQSTTKPCAYFLGYTVLTWHRISIKLLSRPHGLPLFIYVTPPTMINLFQGCEPVGDRTIKADGMFL